MRIQALSRFGAAVLLSSILLPGLQVAHAESTGTSKYPSLSLTPAIRDRMYMQLAPIYVRIKTKSGNAYDVTGPVYATGDGTKYVIERTNEDGQLVYVAACAAAANPSSCRTAYRFAVAALDSVLEDDGSVGLGSPEGIKARASSSASTMALSMGYYLTDDYTWLVEAYLLAKPLVSRVYGDGVNASGQPNGLNGKEIMNTKLLPPMVTLGYQFGKRNDRFRPYLGVAAMYAIFFDTKATETLNSYQGGGRPGDTTVSLKNAFGIGPIGGFKYTFNDKWFVKLDFANVRLKTTATLVTRNTTITSNSTVLADYATDVVDAINIGATYDNRTVTGAFTTELMALIKAGKQADGVNATTYVRKQDTTLENTMFMLSVGYNF